MSAVRRFSHNLLHHNLTCDSHGCCCCCCCCTMLHQLLRVTGKSKSVSVSEHQPDKRTCFFSQSGSHRQVAATEIPRTADSTVKLIIKVSGSVSPSQFHISLLCCLDMQCGTNLIGHLSLKEGKQIFSKSFKKFVQK